jgi:hypothetical protein
MHERVREVRVKWSAETEHGAGKDQTTQTMSEKTSERKSRTKRSASEEKNQRTFSNRDAE